MNTSTRGNNEGMALLMAMFFIGIAIMVVGSLTVRAINEQRHTDHFASYENCMFGIETGLAQSQASLEAGQNGMVGLSEQPEVDTGEEFETYPFDDGLVSAVPMPGMPSTQFFSYAHNWGNDGQDNNGDGTIDEMQEQWMFSVFAAARDGSATRRVEEVVSGQDINVWRNAIFAGAGQSGGLINGNVSVHGSVHLLGDGLMDGTEAIAAIDLSGTSLVHNNYVGMPAELQGRVPALPTRNYNGEEIATLNAKLRVRRGLVGMSGNSEIGEADIAGNGIKETMDGIFVTDGYTGTSVVDDGGRGDPKNMWSDNGWDHTYDCGNKVPLPLLTSSYRTPDTGEKIWDGSRGDWYTHEHYFDEVLVGNETNPTDGIYNGTMLIKTSANFYYNATRPSDTNPANRQTGDDYIYFNATTNRMEINGQITVNGAFELSGKGNDKTIQYTGRGAILVHGNAIINTDLLTINADNSTTESYPVNNCLGIMASGDMTVGSVSQLMLMGAFYAQGRIVCSKQSQVAGTFVSNYFDMGTNVPSIFQVPSLADNLPRGMIGAYPILSFARVSWRELGL